MRRRTMLSAYLTVANHFRAKVFGHRGNGYALAIEIVRWFWVSSGQRGNTTSLSFTKTLANDLICFHFFPSIDANWQLDASALISGA